MGLAAQGLQTLERARARRTAARASLPSPPNSAPTRRTPRSNGSSSRWSTSWSAPRACSPTRLKPWIVACRGAKRAVPNSPPLCANRNRFRSHSRERPNPTGDLCSERYQSTLRVTYIVTAIAAKAADRADDERVVLLLQQQEQQARRARSAPPNTTSAAARALERRPRIERNQHDGRGRRRQIREIESDLLRKRQQQQIEHDLRRRRSADTARRECARPTRSRSRKTTGTPSR